MVAHAESAGLAERADRGHLRKPRRSAPGQLTVHADRGTSMTSKAVALLLADLGITRTHSRRTSPMTTRSPRRSSDPQVPAGVSARFASVEAARAFAIRSSPGTTPSIATAYRLADPRRWCTTGRSRSSAPRAGRSSPRPTPPIPSGRAAPADAARGPGCRLDQPAAPGAAPRLSHPDARTTAPLETVGVRQ